MVFLTFSNYDNGVKQVAVKWYPCYTRRKTRTLRNLHNFDKSFIMSQGGNVQSRQNQTYGRSLTLETKLGTIAHTCN